jgi:hypothetical protein
MMVTLFALEYGVPRTRATPDIDALVNARRVEFGGRAVSSAISEFVSTLVSMEFKEDGVSPEGVAPRYKRNSVSIDVLVPDGLGRDGPQLRTRPPGAEHTVAVPGGTQALYRTELLPVEIEGRYGSIPRPSLLGAIVVKAASVEVDDVPESQREDLVLLLSLVSDVLVMKADVTKGDRRVLRSRREVFDRTHNAWLHLSTGEADLAFAALNLLVAN